MACACCRYRTCTSGCNSAFTSFCFGFSCNNLCKRCRPYFDIRNYARRNYALRSWTGTFDN